MKGVIRFPLPARSGNGKVSAATAYEVVERLPDSSLLRLTFERGQRHQIRRHFQMIGHPLVLDQVYGDGKANRAFGRFLRAGRFFLHASHLRFPHPVTGKIIELSSPLPPAFAAAIKKLKKM
jgi:23S rRNA-/tRNA-specific pseudouridylate synthase